MASIPTTEPRQTLRMARLACFALGVALVLGGLAPAIVQRMVTGHAPGLDAYAASIPPFVLGGLCLWFQRPVGRGRRWALWSAFVLTVVLMAAVLGAWLVGEGDQVPAYVVVLTAGTMLSTWLGLGTPETGRSTGISGT